MVTRTELLDDVGSGGRLPGHHAPAAYVVPQKIDFSDLDNGNGVDNADVIEAINVPENTLVLGVFARVKTGEESDAGDLDDIDIGDGGNASRFLASQNMTAAFDAWGGVGENFAGTVDAGSTSTAEPVVVTNESEPGHFYDAADTIDVKVNTAGADQNTGVLYLYAVMVHLPNVV